MDIGAVRRRSLADLLDGNGLTSGEQMEGEIAQSRDEHDKHCDDDEQGLANLARLALVNRKLLHARRVLASAGLAPDLLFLGLVEKNRRRSGGLHGVDHIGEIVTVIGDVTRRPVGGVGGVVAKLALFGVLDCRTGCSGGTGGLVSVGAFRTSGLLGGQRGGCSLVEKTTGGSGLVLVVGDVVVLDDGVMLPARTGMTAGVFVFLRELAVIGFSPIVRGIVIGNDLIPSVRVALRHIRPGAIPRIALAVASEVNRRERLSQADGVVIFVCLAERTPLGRSVFTVVGDLFFVFVHRFSPRCLLR